MFGKNNSLQEIALVNMRFADRLIDSIGKGLKTNKTLKKLNLEGNLIVYIKLAKIRIGGTCPFCVNILWKTLIWKI